ncbi:MAG: hypothetical protein PsegKO_31770 [Pseudohongiellaceae bacterium]|jgi:hypothetical protein
MSEANMEHPTGQLPPRSLGNRLLRIAVALVVMLILLMVGIYILQRLASERVEVVELHTVDAAGEPVTTRLWVVDDGGYQYLRVGGDGSGWFSRLQAMPSVELSRDGQRARYEPVLRPDKSARINELMQAKYSWGDSVIAALVGSRDGSIPIELQPLP